MANVLNFIINLFSVPVARGCVLPQPLRDAGVRLEAGDEVHNEEVLSASGSSIQYRPSILSSAHNNTGEEPPCCTIVKYRAVRETSLVYYHIMKFNMK